MNIYLRMNSQYKKIQQYLFCYTSEQLACSDESYHLPRNSDTNFHFSTKKNTQQHGETPQYICTLPHLNSTNAEIERGSKGVGVVRKK